jgi:hypothetical protein
MADIGGSHNEAFQSGVSHFTNSGRQNLGSITLGGSLQADSDRWNSLTPHGVLNMATGSQNDSSFEQYQRDQGSYQPGSMSNMQDHLDQGSDNS